MMQRPANTSIAIRQLQIEVIGFDATASSAHPAWAPSTTTHLILSGGIRNAYDAWFGNDQQYRLHLHALPGLHPCNAAEMLASRKSGFQAWAYPSS